MSDTQPRVIVDDVAAARRVRVEGDLDCLSADQFTQLLQRTLEPGSDVYIDLTGVPFIDSYGIRGLVEARELANAEGIHVTVTDVSPSVAALLDMTGLSTLLVGSWSEDEDEVSSTI
jgi:anti-sigma B factor antagonist